VWPVWSAAFLVTWGLLYGAFPHQRRRMMRMSLFTAPFGLTEPLFVPEYWSPPSLLGLALRTGFDLESVVFSFAIGGIGAILYDAVTNQKLEPVPTSERRHRRHRFHRLALAAPALVFPVLYVLPWNPIYPAIGAMAAGAVAAVVCRPDLKLKTLASGGLFLVLYVLLVGGSEWSAPGYIERVWNLEALTGILVWKLPLEELLFAIGFGAYWSALYEHFTWTRGGGHGAMA
jgi:hypothetical protein